MSKTFRASDLANTNVAAMHGYVPGQQPQDGGWVKLNTNENPYPPSPKVAEAIIAELAEGAARLRLYPNPTSAPLRSAVAAHHGLEPAQVLLGNGADDVLNILIRVFAAPSSADHGTSAATDAWAAMAASAASVAGSGTGSGTLAGSGSGIGQHAAHVAGGYTSVGHTPAGDGAGMTVPSYSLYSTLTQAQGAQLAEIAFDASLELPVEAIAASPARIFILTSPNAPTGVAFSPAQIEAVLSRFSGILVVDETYAPFADANVVGLLAKYPNLVVVRSFSKAYALAGMRLGYALASAEIIELLDRVRDSYNLDRLAQAAGLAAITDQPYYVERIEQIKRTRQAAAADYASRGWFTYPSQANFHFTRPQTKDGRHGVDVATDCFEFLKKEHVLVRAFPGHALTRSFLRISVGSEQEMARLKDVLDRWQAQTATGA